VILDEGLEVSFERHGRAAAACRAGARAMEIELWPAGDSVAAACVTALSVPADLTDIQVRDHCRDRYGVMISAGQGAGNLVRIGHMGPTARSLYPAIGLAAVGRTLADLGVPVKIGDGLEAVLAALSGIDQVSTPTS
jgi:pyridoxamine--pyruvate transaminase